MLSRMSSPIYPSAVPFYTFDMPALLKALGENNVQPLILFGAGVGDISTVREIAGPAAHRPRKLIMSGVKEIVLPTTVRRIDTELTTDKFDFNELNALPWEALGATAIKKWMRHEWEGENSINPRSGSRLHPTGEDLR